MLQGARGHARAWLTLARWTGANRDLFLQQLAKAKNWGGATRWFRPYKPEGFTSAINLSPRDPDVNQLEGAKAPAAGLLPHARRGPKIGLETNFGTNPNAILGCDLLRLAMRARRTQDL